MNDGFLFDKSVPAGRNSENSICKQLVFFLIILFLTIVLVFI